MSTIKKDKVTVRQAVLPLKVLFHHLRLFFLIILAIAILVVSRVDNAKVQAVRGAVMDSITPVLSALSAPVSSYRSARDGITQAIAVYHENARLRQENERLLRMQSVALELEGENRRLRTMLQFVPQVTSEFVTARIVGDTSTPYGKSALVNAGISEGVKVGQVVYNREGLVGRVTEAGFRNARVLLLTDINSRVPVMGESSREHAVLAGNNGNIMDLLHLPLESRLVVGERIITSGDGEYFPGGIAVGTVTAVAEDRVDVQPLVDWSRLEYVTIAGVHSGAAAQTDKKSASMPWRTKGGASFNVPAEAATEAAAPAP